MAALKNKSKILALRQSLLLISLHIKRFIFLICGKQMLIITSFVSVILP